MHVCTPRCFTLRCQGGRYLGHSDSHRHHDSTGRWTALFASVRDAQLSRDILSFAKACFIQTKAVSRFVYETRESDNPLLISMNLRRDVLNVR